LVSIYLFREVLACPLTPADTGAIVGGVIGGVAALLLLGGLIWFFLRRRRRQREVAFDEKTVSGQALR
jgi:LPXTG-motif cell wall-anchored protein